jgi:hypothetical protein
MGVAEKIAANVLGFHGAKQSEVLLVQSLKISNFKYEYIPAANAYKCPTLIRLN